MSIDPKSEFSILSLFFPFLEFHLMIFYSFTPKSLLRNEPVNRKSFGCWLFYFDELGKLWFPTADRHKIENVNREIKRKRNRGVSYTYRLEKMRKKNIEYIFQTAKYGKIQYSFSQNVDNFFFCWNVAGLLYNRSGDLKNVFPQIERFSIYSLCYNKECWTEHI